MTQNSTLKTRNYEIDFLKFIFSILVLLQHSKGISDVVPANIGYWGAGHIAVYFFFAVSGFLMVNSFYRHRDNNLSPAKASWHFYKGKVKSLWIDFLGALVIIKAMRIVARVHNGQIDSIDDAIRYIINSIPEALGISAGGFTEPTNGPTWYISAMLIVMPVLYYILSRNPQFYLYVFSPFTVIMLLGYRYRTRMLDTPVWNVFDAYTENIVKAILGICCGALAYIVYRKIISTNWTKLGVGTLTALEITGYATVFAVSLLWSNTVTTRLTMQVVFIPLIALSFSQISYVSRLFVSKLWLKLGTFSLPLYLNHCAVQMYFEANLAHQSYKTNLILYFVFSITLALVEYFGVRLIIKGFKKLNLKLVEK